MGKYLDNEGLLYFWQKIKNTFATKSTTLSGYGITNAYTKGQVDNAISQAIQAIDSGVVSVNEKTGEVVLTSADINYNATTSIEAAIDQLMKGTPVTTVDEIATDLNDIGGTTGTIILSRWNQTTLNTPFTQGITETYNAGICITYSTGANYRTQVVFVNASRYTARRGMNNGTWQTWELIPKLFDIPTKLSQLTNDGNFVSDANYVHTDNNYTTTEKNKLANLVTGVSSVNTKTGAVTLTAADINYDTNNTVAAEIAALLDGVDSIVIDEMATDLNDEYVLNGVKFSKYDTNTLNTPFKEGLSPDYPGGLCITYASTANAQTQFAISNASRYTFRRGKTNGTWNSWERVVRLSDIPTKTSQLTNDSDFVSDANYVHTDSNFTSAEKTKLAGIATGATKITVDSSLSNSSTNPVQNKVINAALNAKAPLASPELTGTPTAPTAAKNTNTTQIATTAFVMGQGYLTQHQSLTAYAKLAGPTFTGTPKAPTAAAGTNTTQIATTAFVATAISNAQVGTATFQGTVTKEADISGLSTYKKGYYWVVSTAGTYVGQTCEAGDMIFCISDKGSAYAASDFSIVQNNIVTITNAEIDTIVAS